MSKFNTTVFDSTSTNYNTEVATYMYSATNTIPLRGTSYYPNKVPDVMCGFCVDNMDSVFGGNVIITGDTKICSDLYVTGTIYGTSASGSSSSILSSNNTFTGTNSFPSVESSFLTGKQLASGFNVFTSIQGYSELATFTAPPVDVTVK